MTRQPLDIYRDLLPSQITNNDTHIELLNTLIFYNLHINLKILNHETMKKTEILFVMAITLLFASCNSGGSNTNPKTYQEKIMSIQEIERSQPTNFLTASGNYNENFWGDILKVHGVIKNSATVATYKDAVVRVKYYSKTKTELGSKDYTIYEIFPPHSEIKFELEIKNYKDVNSLGWEVIKAIPTE